MKPNRPGAAVAHIIPALFGRDGVLGGAERYAFELARHMAQLTPTKLITFGTESRRETKDGLEVEVIGDPHYVRGQKQNPISVRPLIAALRDADVVHCHQQHIAVSSFAAAFCRLTRRRVFVSDLGGGGWDISSYMRTDGWYHGHLHISEYSRRIFGHSMYPDAHVILGGVDVESFSPRPPIERNGHVLFVGRIMPHKGINYLIEALPEDMTLDVIGQPYHEEFFAYLQSLSRGKKVNFHHECRDEDVIDAYRR